MLDVKDPSIKLFGKTIPLPETQIPADPLQKSHPGGQIPTHHPQHKHNEDMFVATTKMKVEDSLEEHCKQDKSAAATNDGGDNNQTPSQRDTASDEDRVESDTSGQEKEGLKKPDKIVPCPRCNSLDTKFCYYNNYNVNQPRHFCKNCQRYWTAGGTMRNVPVGAGRRKNKHIASQYRHIIMSSDGTPTAPIDTPDLANHQILSCGVLSIPARSIIGNEAVMKFRPEAPLCESMTSVLNLGDQKKEVEMAATASAENGQKPPSCGSSMVTSTSGEEVFPENVVKREEHCISGSFCIPTHAVQFYPGPPWLYPWGSGWNGVDPIAPGQCSSEMLHRPDNGNTKVVQWGSTSTVAAPAFCTPPTPFPFGPATYWGCMQGFATGAWNMPWAGCTGIPSPSSSTSKSGCSSTGSPTLGKHSRDTNLQVENKSEKCLWVPKTLRIDDPDEAAKSSIWDTLGIKPKKNEPLPKGGVFKAFQPKTKGSVCESESTNVMHANPAALSRSQTFQEST